MYDLSVDKCARPCSRHYTVHISSTLYTFPAPWMVPVCPVSGQCQPPRLWGSHWSAFCCSWLDLSFLEFDINGNLQYVLFRVWFLSLSLTFLRFIQVVVRVSSPSLLLAERRRVLRTHHRWLTCSPVDGLWAVSRFELLRIKPLRIFVYRSVFLFLSGKCREVE